MPVGDVIQILVPHLDLILGVIGIVIILYLLVRNDAIDRNFQKTWIALHDERYQKSIDMLSRSDLSARLEAIHVLHDLAEVSPHKWHVRVSEDLCRFIKKPTTDLDIERAGRLRDDVQLSLTLLGRRRNERLELEEHGAFQLRLHGAHLAHADLRRVNLSNAYLTQADLSDSCLLACNLSNATLTGADLSGAIFAQRKESDPQWDIVRGLTQTQVDSAWSDENNPPIAVLVKENGEKENLPLAVLEKEDWGDAQPLHPPPSRSR